MSTLNFSHNAFVIPVVNTITTENLQLYVVESGSTVDKVNLFKSCFLNPYNKLYVVPLPDFDTTDLEKLNHYIDEFQDNHQQWISQSYEIKF